MTTTPLPRAVTRTRKRTRHGFHAVMSVLTGGMWAVTVWPACAAWNRWGPAEVSTTNYR